MPVDPFEMFFFWTKVEVQKFFAQANRYILLFRCAAQVQIQMIFEYKEDVLVINKLLHGNVEHSLICY